MTAGRDRARAGAGLAAGCGGADRLLRRLDLFGRSSASAAAARDFRRALAGLLYLPAARGAGPSDDPKAQDTRTEDLPTTASNS